MCVRACVRMRAYCMCLCVCVSACAFSGCLGTCVCARTRACVRACILRVCMYTRERIRILGVLRHLDFVFDRRHLGRVELHRGDAVPILELRNLLPIVHSRLAHNVKDLLQLVLLELWFRFRFGFRSFWNCVLGLDLGLGPFGTGPFGPQLRVRGLGFGVSGFSV